METRQCNKSGLNVKLSWPSRNQNGKFDDPETGTAIDLRAFPIEYAWTLKRCLF